MNEAWGRRIGVFTGISFFVFLLYKATIGQDVLPLRSGDGLQLQSLPDSVFTFVFAAGFALLAYFYGQKAWTSSAEEYYAWLKQIYGPRFPGFFSRNFKPSYFLWKDRLISPFTILMGSLIAFYGFYCIAINILVALGWASI